MSEEKRKTDSGWKQMSFLEACIECDDECLHELLKDGVTEDKINEVDESGKTGLSHASGNGFLPILELLTELADLKVNIADKDGNTPLIFAAQAGHEESVSFLLNNFTSLKVDQTNMFGFSALMKAAIQGRTQTAKLLLFAGANANKRDNGRRFCAMEWARFCGRHKCSLSIHHFVHSPRYLIAKTFFLSRMRCKSDSDLKKLKENKNENDAVDDGGAEEIDGINGEKIMGERMCDSEENCEHYDEKSVKTDLKKERRGSLGWIQRHLSLKRKKRQSLSLCLELQMVAVTGVAMTGGARVAGMAGVTRVAEVVGDDPLVFNAATNQMKKSASSFGEKEKNVNLGKEGCGNYKKSNVVNCYEPGLKPRHKDFLTFCHSFKTKKDDVMGVVEDLSIKGGLVGLGAVGFCDPRRNTRLPLIQISTDD